MHRVGGMSIVGEVVAVLEAYLDVLTALAVTEQGAGSMFVQLHKSAPRMLSWRRMLEVMKLYTDRYTLQADRQASNQCHICSLRRVSLRAESDGIASHSTLRFAITFNHYLHMLGLACMQYGQAGREGA